MGGRFQTQYDSHPSEEENQKGTPYTDTQTFYYYGWKPLPT